MPINARLFRGVSVHSFPHMDPYPDLPLEFPPDHPELFVFNVKRDRKHRKQFPAKRDHGEIRWAVIGKRKFPVFFNGNSWQRVLPRKLLHQRFPGLNGGD